MAWTTADIPDQSNKTIIVTGANSGIGFETALELVKKNATVVLACRNQEKGAEAVKRIEATDAPGLAVLMSLDLSSLDSVRSFAADFQSRYSQLDLLINNAGVMIPPLSRTKEGFELQFGTNHLGHFLLTTLLLPMIEASGGRIVNVSSNAHKMGKIDFEDPNYQKRTYHRLEAYNQSKLANLLFTLELNKRLNSSEAKAVSAHPGWTASALARTAWWADLPHRVFGQSAEMGALPTLRAAVDPEADPGDYYGPSSMFEIRGAPVKVEPVAAAKDEDTAAQLWTLSEELTSDSSRENV